MRPVCWESASPCDAVRPASVSVDAIATQEYCQVPHVGSPVATQTTSGFDWDGDAAE
jgi:hypothetical protein